MLFLVTFHSLGNLYIADTENNRIRKVTISIGIITTIAGTGTGSYSGDNGVATAATLNGPRGVSLDSAGKPPFLLLHNLFDIHALPR